MNIDKLIFDFAKEKVGEILVTDSAGEILYRNHVMAFSDATWKNWTSRELPDKELTEDMEWEILDSEGGRDYHVRTSVAEQDGRRLILHHVYDVSEYYALVRALSAYTKERQLMENFQQEMMEKLSGNISDCLPIIVRFLQVKQVILCVERKFCVEVYCMDRDSGKLTQRMEPLDRQFDTPREEHVRMPGREGRDYLCYITETTIHGRYAIYLPGEIDDEWDTFPMHYGVIRLFVENVLTREEIIYENEHDALTGLYNKGKYLSMMKEFLPGRERIAVFNMDVNYLKRLNDSRGHDAGDKLLIKAAMSMTPLVRSNVAAYRIGGDEFMMIAWDLEEKEALQLKSRWQEELERLNRADDEIECVIACGLVWGGPGHDLEAMLKEADEKMYQDKVAIKAARGEAPDAR